MKSLIPAALIAFAFSASATRAAGLLDPAAEYPLDKSIREKSPAFQPLDSSFSEMQTEIKSFRPNARKPFVSSHASQLLRFQRQGEYAPGEQRVELTFQRHTVSSLLETSPHKPPVKREDDFRPYLQGKVLLIVDEGNGSRRIQDLDKLHAYFDKEVPDQSARQMLHFALTENALLRDADLMLPSGCYTACAGRVPGEKWRMTLQEQGGVKVSLNCEFRGWAWAGKKRIAVLAYDAPQWKQGETLPDGVKVTSERVVQGTLYFEPASREALLRKKSVAEIVEGGYPGLLHLRLEFSNRTHAYAADPVVLANPPATKPGPESWWPTLKKSAAAAWEGLRGRFTRP